MCFNDRFIRSPLFDEFNSFYPMEVIATSEEVNQIVSQNSDKSYLLFPEDRSNPIRMTDDLPYKWIKDGKLLEKAFSRAESILEIPHSHNHLSFTFTILFGYNMFWSSGFIIDDKRITNIFNRYKRNLTHMLCVKKSTHKH